MRTGCLAFGGSFCHKKWLFHEKCEISRNSDNIIFGEPPKNTFLISSTKTILKNKVSCQKDAESLVILMLKVSSVYLYYLSDSLRRTFQTRKSGQFLEVAFSKPRATTAAATATAAANELPQPIQAPSSTHPGTTYPVREIPHSDLIKIQRCSVDMLTENVNHAKIK